MKTKAVTIVLGLGADEKELEYKGYSVIVSVPQRVVGPERCIRVLVEVMTSPDDEEGSKVIVWRDEFDTVKDAITLAKSYINSREAAKAKQRMEFDKEMRAWEALKAKEPA